MSEKNFLIAEHNDQDRGSDEKQEPSEGKSKLNVGVLILDTFLVLSSVITIILLWVKVISETRMGEIVSERAVLLSLIVALIPLLVAFFSHNRDRRNRDRRFLLTMLGLLIFTNVILALFVGTAVLNGARISMVEDAGYSSVKGSNAEDFLDKYEGVKDGQEYIIKIKQGKDGIYYEVYSKKSDPVETGEIGRKAKRDDAS